MEGLKSLTGKVLNLKSNLLIVVVTLVCGSAAFAVSGPCYKCHTMHNSQNGTVVNSNGTYPYLLNKSCIACHTGINDGTNKTPYIFSQTPPIYNATGTEPDTNTLAGGNFYWMVYGTSVPNTAADECGHNVAELGNPDDILSTPPGFDGTFANAAGEIVGNGTWPAGQQVTCAGLYGCHGHHRPGDDDYKGIYGAHHGNKGNDGVTPLTNATTVGNSYRFLLGIYGIESANYEYHPTATNHNQYYGQVRDSTTPLTASTADKHTISYLCAECHGYYHSGSGQISSSDYGVSPWLRHPTDFDMTDASGSEYQYYNGATNSTAAPYSVIAPVASDDLTKGVLSVVDVKPGDPPGTAIVTCISCHRAHGTPYADILRWDFRNWPSNGKLNGCTICHTQKD
ncbi:hypothetical protein [Desulfurobacterium sp.]